MINKHESYSIDKPDIVYGVHHFEDGYATVGIGHSRIPTDTYTSEAIGTPIGLLLYNGDYIRVFNVEVTSDVYSSEFYNNDTLLFTWVSSDAVDYAIIDDLLILSDGSNIVAYDHEHPTWGLQQLGNDAPILVSSDATPSTSGDIEAGTYYYRYTYEDAWGYEGMPSDAIQVIVSSDNSSVVLNSIPLCTSDKAYTTNIYRTYCDNLGTEYDGVYHLVAQVSSDSYTDTSNDAVLTETLRYGLEWGLVYRSKPEGKNLHRWGQRLTWTNGNTLYISTIDDYGQPAPGETQVRYKIGDDTDIIATALDSNDLIVFKSSGIYRVRQYSYDIITLTESMGIRDKRHTIEWRGTIAFLSGDRVYSLSPFKEIGRDISPIYSEYTSIVGNPYMMVDHRHRLYITATVESNVNPTWTTDKYVTYITDGNSWSRTINLDWLYMLADYTNNVTVGLDKLGYMERLNHSYCKSKVYSPIITSTYTVVNSTKIRLATLVGVQAGDYLWYYSSISKLIYLSEIIEVGSDTVGEATIPYVKVADALWTAPYAGDTISIGGIYSHIEGNLYDPQGIVIDCRGIQAIVDSANTNFTLGFGFGSKYHMQSMATSIDQDNLLNITNQKRHWFLQPSFIGFVQGAVRFLSLRLNLDRAGRKA